MEEEGSDEIFVYTGGEQVAVVPRDVRRVRIDASVKSIPVGALQHRRSLIYVEFHDGIERIEVWTFQGCVSLRRVKLLGVKVIRWAAFDGCSGLTDVEGNKLETIGSSAFQNCTSLRSVGCLVLRTLKKGRSMVAVS
jgi:hypothetical protein